MTNVLSLADGLYQGPAARILLEVALQPVMGSRFQPTGFPDLGGALFPDPSGAGERLLVESAQSMANRLEKVCWEDANNRLVPALSGLPYVQIGGQVSSSSILEAHRLNSPYILADKTFESALKEKAGLNQGTVDRRRFAAALMHYDPNSLVHGTFMSQIKPGTARLERLLSSFIEAEDARVAESGGVKIDRNDTSGRDAGGAAEGFGNVPFHRTEYVARRISAWFSLDLAGLRGLGLPPAGARLVLLLALFKVRAFLTHPMRLRTACDLQAVQDDARTWTKCPEGFVLPDLEALQEGMAGAIAAAKEKGLFADPPVTQVVYKKKPRGSSKGTPQDS